MSELSKRVLSILMVTGAQSREKAIPIGDLAEKLQVPPDTVAAEVNELVVGNYAEVIGGTETPRVYLTGNGVITASSTYS
jgi:DNA-binding Lrp family transcriptional regulator